MGLLDFLTTDKDQQAALAQGLLSGAFGAMAGRGTRLQAIGQGGLAGVQGYAGAREQQTMSALKNAQLEDIKNQAALRDAQLKMMQRRQSWMEQFMGGQGMSTPEANAATIAATGNLRPTVQNGAVQASLTAPQSGSDVQGVPRSAIAADFATNDGKNVGEWLFKRNTPNIEYIGGVAVDKNTAKPGSSLPQVSQNGQASQVVQDPSAPGGWRIIMPQGAAQTVAANTIAAELPKALIQGGLRREDFQNPDGTTKSVTGLQFLQNSGGLDALTGLIGGLGGNPQAPQVATQTTPQATPRPADTRVPPDVQGARDQERLRILQREYSTATGEDKAAIGREIQRAGGVVSGIPTQTKIANEAQGSINQTWLKSSYEPALASGSAANDMLTSVKTARFALSGLGDTGFGTGAKESAARVLGALGVPNAEQFASNGAIFQQAAGERLFTLLGNQKGPQTEGDAARAQKTFASISIPKQANQYILDLAEAVAQRDAMKANFYREALPLAQKEGDLSVVDRKWQNIQRSVFDMPSMQKWKDRVK